MVFQDFYAGDCRRLIEEFLAGFEPLDEPAELFAGVVPHAGWQYSGKVAAHVWKALATRAKPETVIVFGAVHSGAFTENSVYPDGEWETPLGPAEVDQELAAEIVEEVKPLAVADPGPHLDEHSIEVQMPFIKALLPRARVVPIAVPRLRNPVQLGDLLSHLTRERRVVAVGSTDLTHYGEERYSFAPRGTGAQAHEWMKQNDKRLLDIVEALRAEEIPPEVAAHRNACNLTCRRTSRAR